MRLKINFIRYVQLDIRGLRNYQNFDLIDNNNLYRNRENHSIFKFVIYIDLSSIYSKFIRFELNMNKKE